MTDVFALPGQGKHKQAENIFHQTRKPYLHHCKDTPSARGLVFSHLSQGTREKTHLVSQGTLGTSEPKPLPDSGALPSAAVPFPLPPRQLRTPCHAGAPRCIGIPAHITPQCFAHGKPSDTERNEEQNAKGARNRSWAAGWEHGDTAHRAPGAPRTKEHCCLRPKHQHTHTDLLSLYFQLGGIKPKLGITHLPPSILCITKQLANNKWSFGGILDASPITDLLPKLPNLRHTAHRQHRVSQRRTPPATKRSVRALSLKHRCWENRN